MSVGKDFKEFTPQQWLNLSVCYDSSLLLLNITKSIEKWVEIKEVCKSFISLVSDEPRSKKELYVLSTIIDLCGMCDSFMNSRRPTQIKCINCPLFDMDNPCYQREKYETIFSLIDTCEEDLSELAYSDEDMEMIISYADELIDYLKSFKEYVSCAD